MQYQYYAYEVLEDAIADGRLCDYLLAAPGYRCVKGNHDYPVFNDFESVVFALNDYGNEHPGFAEHLHGAVREALSRQNAGAAYCLTQIFRYQAALEQHGENSIRFITREMCTRLREVIAENRSVLEDYREFEGEDYENGMYGAIRAWGAKLAETSAYQIF